MRRRTPRWLKSVITASCDEVTKLPFDRNRRTPVEERRRMPGRAKLRLVKA